MREATYFAVQDSIKCQDHNNGLIKGDYGNYKAARNLLGETFGTKKKKKEIKSAEKNRVDVQDLALTASSIDNAIEEKIANLPSKQDAQEEIEDSKPLPPFDKDATRLEDAYKIESIISTAEFEIIPTQMFSQISMEKINEQEKLMQLTPFVKACLRKLAEGDGKSDILLLPKIIYLQLLIHFKSTRENSLGSLQKNQRLNGIFTPKLIISKFLDAFTTSDVIDGATKYKVSDWHKEKLIAYICVLALLIDNFACNVDLLAKDLKMPAVKLADRFKSIGCSVSTVKSAGVSSKIAELKVPLVFPKLRVMPRNK